MSPTSTESSSSLVSSGNFDARVVDDIPYAYHEAWATNYRKELKDSTPEELAKVRSSIRIPKDTRYHYYTDREVRLKGYLEKLLTCMLHAFFNLYHKPCDDCPRDFTEKLPHDEDEKWKLILRRLERFCRDELDLDLRLGNTL